MSNEAKKARWACVVANAKLICVDTYSGYRSCSRDPNGKHHVLRPDVVDEDLGTALLDAIKHSRFLTPQEHPEFYDWKSTGQQQYEAWVKSLMESHGYRTRRELFGAMKSCGVKCQDAVVTIRPSHHRILEAWSGDGITEQDWVNVSESSSPEAIGAALRLALSRCT
jgi:hypothetical protein